jgi:hypothetical protein
VKISSAAMASSICTRSRRAPSDAMVVSQTVRGSFPPALVALLAYASFDLAEQPLSSRRRNCRPAASFHRAP